MDKTHRRWVLCLALMTAAILPAPAQTTVLFDSTTLEVGQEAGLGTVLAVGKTGELVKPLFHGLGVLKTKETASRHPGQAILMVKVDARPVYEGVGKVKTPGAAVVYVLFPRPLALPTEPGPYKVSAELYCRFFSPLWDFEATAAAPGEGPQAIKLQKPLADGWNLCEGLLTVGPSPLFLPALKITLPEGSSTDALFQFGIREINVTRVPPPAPPAR